MRSIMRVYICEEETQKYADCVHSSFPSSSAYDTDKPFASLLNTAMVLPIFDGGNVGIRRRHMQELMAKPTYDAWASTYGPTSSSSS